MQEEEKNNGMEGMSVEEMFLGVQESYQEAQLRAQEENRAFARTEFFRMDKFGTYRLRILPIAPNPDGSPTRPGYEYPVHQLLRPFLRQGEVPPLPGRVPPGRGLLPARETAHAGAQSLL
jgi:hypothetical protein